MFVPVGSETPWFYESNEEVLKTSFNLLTRVQITLAQAAGYSFFLCFGFLQRASCSIAEEKEGDDTHGSASLQSLPCSCCFLKICCLQNLYLEGPWKRSWAGKDDDDDDVFFLGIEVDSAPPTGLCVHCRFTITWRSYMRLGSQPCLRFTVWFVQTELLGLGLLKSRWRREASIVDSQQQWWFVPFATHVFMLWL